MQVFLKTKKFKLFIDHIIKNYKNSKDPISQLLSNYKELFQILELKQIEKRKIEVIYSSRDKIDEILRNQEKDIFLKYNLTNKIIPYFFHMCLLIGFNTVFMNYSYDINDCIKNINDYLDKIKKESKNDIEYKYKSLILSKFIIDLINNCEEKNDEIIKNIKEANTLTFRHLTETI